MIQAHVFISGFVQGVGFRQLVKKEARKRGLTGWVKNTRDNRVEAVFVGDKSRIEEMIKLCKKGPFLAEVKEVKAEREKTEQEYKSFEVVSQ